MTPPRLNRGFPWRTGNRFDLLINGDAFFPAMLEAIDRSEKSIQLEMYLMASGRVADRFIEHMTAAASRGVEVQLLLDAFGAMGLNAYDRDRLLQADVQLAFYNPLHLRKLEKNLFRTHRKLLLVDDAIAFVGGAGITDHFVGERAWRETMVGIQGPIVADWVEVFNNNWAWWTRTEPLPRPDPPAPFEDGLRGRVACNKGEMHAEIKRAFLNRLGRVKERAWIATAYFVPSLKVRQRLRRAARSGRDVRLLLPGPVTDHPAIRYASQRYYSRLLRHGVRIFEYQRCFMHTKAALVDDWTSIGSSNLDRWNLRWNLEANQEVEAASFAARVASMLEDDFAHSKEITYDEWRERTRLQRLKERFWGNIELRLATFSSRSSDHWPPNGP